MVFFDSANSNTDSSNLHSGIQVESMNVAATQQENPESQTFISELVQPREQNQKQNNQLVSVPFPVLNLLQVGQAIDSMMSSQIAAHAAAMQAMSDSQASVQSVDETTDSIESTDANSGDEVISTPIISTTVHLVQPETYNTIDESETSPDLLRAEAMSLATPVTVEFADRVYASLKNIEESCANDAITLCGDNLGSSSPASIFARDIQSFFNHMDSHVQVMRTAHLKPETQDNTNRKLSMRGILNRIGIVQESPVNLRGSVSTAGRGDHHHDHHKEHDGSKPTKDEETEPVAVDAKKPTDGESKVYTHYNESESDSDSDSGSDSEGEDGAHGFARRRHGRHQPDTFYSGAIGFGASTDKCLFENYQSQQLSQPCAAAIADHQALRQEYWSIASEQGPPHHGPSFLFLCLIGFIGYRIVRKVIRHHATKGDRKAMRQILHAVNNNPDLKAVAEAQAGVAMPAELPPIDRPCACKGLFHKVIRVIGFIILAFFVVFSSFMFAGMLFGPPPIDAEGKPDPEHGPNGLLVLFVLISIMTAQVMAIKYVFKKCFSKDSTSITPSGADNGDRRNWMKSLSLSFPWNAMSPQANAKNGHYVALVGNESTHYVSNHNYGQEQEMVVVHPPFVNRNATSGSYVQLVSASAPADATQGNVSAAPIAHIPIRMI